MPGFREEVERLLDKHDVEEVISRLVKGPTGRLIYVLEIGLHHLAARKRAGIRRGLRAVVQPKFKKGKNIGSVVLTESAKRRLVEHSRELFSGWMINANVSLGDATREDLLVQAEMERNSADGHIRNAQFYEALAEPLEAGQTVRDYWRDPKVVAKIKERFIQDEDRV